MKASPLRDPLLNRGTAFSKEERDRLKLHGLLPFHISSLDEQLKRCYLNYTRKNTPLGKYVYLMGLMNRNETLFYQFLSRHAEEMLPYIYTPTVGEAALQFSFLSWYPRGLYLSYPLRDRMKEMIDNIANEKIQVIVVTDGERILGLGDLGIGGMTIPIGKLSLYTLFAGIHPSKTLPVFLDVGTNNEELLRNELYLGWRSPRIEKEEYDLFVESFIDEIFKKFPKVFLQWEDFGKTNARRLLDRYRDRYLSFNDDIQGTAAVVLAAIFAAAEIQKQKLTDQKIVIFGGGSAGLGIAELLVKAMQAGGLSEEEAFARIYIVDRFGLIHFNLAPEEIDEAQRAFIKKAKDLQRWELLHSNHISLLEVVKNAHPTVLIGVSAQSGAFTQEIVEAVAERVSRPIVLPLSNPTSRVECVPSDLFQWTKGQAIVATGTPFQPVEYEGKLHKISQCNNVYFFPGLGLGALAAEAKQVSDLMIFKGVEALGLASPALKDPQGPLFPPLGEVRELSRSIALAVAKQAIKEGLSDVPEEELESRIDQLRWNV